MRDCHGIERGHCVACAAAGNECAEFSFNQWRSNGDTDDEGEPLDDVEEYRRNPLLPCIQARFRHPAAVTEIPTVCGDCGCTADGHIAVEVTEFEKRCLEVARRLFAPLELRLCIQQSVRDTCTLGLERGGFTYGEVGLLSFLRLLDRVQALLASNAASGGRGKVFYDLGCGVGKAVVLAALHPIAFSLCVGVELLPGVYAMAEGLRARWDSDPEAQSACSAIGGAMPAVTFVEGDLFEVDLSQAALVLVNAGSWQEPSITWLRQHLMRSMPDGCILVTIRKRLAEECSTELVHLEELHLPMSWGVAPVFLAQRQRVVERSVPQPFEQRIDLESMD